MGFSSLRFTAPWTEREQRKELPLQPGTSRNCVPGESLPVPQPTRLFESHRGASAGLVAPTCSCCLASAASTPGCRHAWTWAPAPKARDTLAARGKGGVCGDCSISCFFFKHMVVFIVLLGCFFFTMQLTVSTAAQNQCVYIAGPALHTGVQIMVSSSPVQ